MTDNEVMPDCPRCTNEKANWVSYAWCGKYRCTRCEWVFGIIPNQNEPVTHDQFCWWATS